MEEQTPISEFNIAVSNLIVIRHLLNDCIIASRNLSSFDWIHSLTNLFKESTRYMTYKDIENKKKDIKEMLFKVNNSITKLNNHAVNQIKPEMYWELTELEIYLRNVLKKAGVLDKIKDDVLAPEEEWN